MHPLLSLFFLPFYFPIVPRLNFREAVNEVFFCSPPREVPWILPIPRKNNLANFLGEHLNTTKGFYKQEQKGCLTDMAEGFGEDWIKSVYLECICYISLGIGYSSFPVSVSNNFSPNFSRCFITQQNIYSEVQYKTHRGFFVSIVFIRRKNVIINL